MERTIDKRFRIPGIRGQRKPGEFLEKHLREQIAAGAFPDGLRLPNTLAWAKALGINDRRVQSALSRLAAQGFLERRPRYGTHVRWTREKRRIIILVGWQLVEEHLHQIRKMVELLIGEIKSRDYEVEVIDNLFALLTNDFPRQKEKVAQLRDRLLSLDPSGYVEYTFDLSRLPDLYPALKRPRVSFGNSSTVDDVYFDQCAGIRTSLRHLASNGRRKVILIRSAGRLSSPHRETSAFWESVQEFGFLRGMFLEFYHGSVVQNVEEDACQWMTQVIRSWRGLRKNYIPDSLLVTDDILMRGVAAALIQANIRVPEDLLAVTHANENVRFAYGIPVVRCEVPLGEIAKTLAEVLILRIEKRQTKGKPVLISTVNIDARQPH